MLGSKFTKFLSFLKQQISFYSNFPSIFRVMRHNSSVFFFSTKGSYESTNLEKFYMSSQQSQILHFNGLLFSKSYTVSAEKSTEEFLITLKSDEKFKEKLTCSFKHDIRNLVNFHPTIQKSENSTLTGSFCPKYKGLRF